MGTWHSSVGLTAVLTLGLIPLACSGGHDPALTQTGETPAPKVSLEPGTLPQGQHLAGAYTLHLGNTATPSATLNEVRVGNAIGDTFNEVGLTPTMNGGLCDCFRVGSLDLVDPDTVRVTFDIDHPFAALLRPDLDGFNLKAQIVTPDAVAVGTEQVDPDLIENADGYSSLWVSQVPGAVMTLFPYVILSEDMSSAPFDFQTPFGWNVFAAGQSYQSAIEFHIPTGTTVDLRLYLTVDYGQSAIRATRQNPQYDLPKFAGKAPWKVAVTELANTLQEDNLASNATWQVDVWDWGHGAALGTDATGLIASFPAFGSTQPIPFVSGNGLDPTPLTATVSVTNANNVAAGDYWGLIEATDEATTGTAIGDDLATPFGVSSYSTFQVFPITVAPMIPTSDPPVAAFADPCATAQLVQGRSVRFDASASTDDLTPVGSLLYDWDFNYDGVTFDLDGTGITINHTFAATGAVTVGLRVTDGDAQSDIATLALTILASGWRNLRNINPTPGNEFLQVNSTYTGQRLFVDDSSEAHAFYVNSSGGLSVANMGGGCAGTTPAITSFPGTAIPDGESIGDIAHFVQISGTSLNYVQYNLATRTVVATLPICTASQVGGGFLYPHLAVDSNNGNLFVVLENSALDLWGTESAAGGTSWSTPVLIHARGTSSSPAYGDAIVSNGQCLFGYRTASWTPTFVKKTFGNPTWTAPSPMGFSSGLSLLFVLVHAPNNDVVGTYFDNPVPIWYIRWNSTTQSWSRAQVENTASNFDVLGWPVVDSTGLVTITWEHLPVPYPTPQNRDLRFKQFMYTDTPAAIMANPTQTLTNDPTYNQEQCVTALDPNTDGVVAVWMRDVDPSVSVLNYDLWSASY